MSEREEIIKAAEEHALSKDSPDHSSFCPSNCDRRGLEHVAFDAARHSADAYEAKITALRAELEQAKAARVIPEPSDQEIERFLFAGFGGHCDEPAIAFQVDSRWLRMRARQVVGAVLAYARQAVGPVVIRKMSHDDVERIALEAWLANPDAHVVHMVTKDAIRLAEAEIASKISGARLEEET